MRFRSTLTPSSLVCQVSDVSALAELPSLQTLYLDGTAVREGSLEHLATHSALSALSVAGISVADGNNILQIISGELHIVCVCTAGVLTSERRRGRETVYSRSFQIRTSRSAVLLFD